MDKKPLSDEIAEQQRRTVLLVLTGPSGAGKDTVIAELVRNNPQMGRVITTTTRQMREGESEGSPYHFISREKFEQLIAEDAFLEWVEFRGELYGTQKQTFLDTMQSGNDVIWKIEMKGVKNMKEKIKKLAPRSVFIFLTGLTVPVLHDRVLKAEGVENIDKRWNEPLVVWEMKQYRDCEYLVINEDEKLDKAIATVQAIMEAKRCELLE